MEVNKLMRMDRISKDIGNFGNASLRTSLQLSFRIGLGIYIRIFLPFG